MDVNNLLKKSENMVASRGVSKVVSRVVTRNLFRGVTGYFIFWGSKLWCTSRGVYLLKTGVYYQPWNQSWNQPLFIGLCTPLVFRQQRCTHGSSLGYKHKHFSFLKGVSTGVLKHKGCIQSYKQLLFSGLISGLVTGV